MRTQNRRIAALSRRIAKLEQPVTETVPCSLADIGLSLDQIRRINRYASVVQILDEAEEMYCPKEVS